MLNELFILSKIKEGDIKAFEEVFLVIIPLFAGMLPVLSVRWK